MSSTYLFHSLGLVGAITSEEELVLETALETAPTSQTQAAILQKEVDYLARALKQDGYPSNFICSASAPLTQKTTDTSSRDEKQEEERGPLVVIPYVAGMSEDIIGVFAGSSHQSSL